MRTRYQFISAEESVQVTTSQALDLSTPCHEAFLHIACDAAWLLGQGGFAHSLESFRKRYMAVLGDQGLAMYSGTIRARELLKAFKNHYPPDLLTLLHCGLDGQTVENWLVRLVRAPDNAQHPLYHLLFIHFLGYTADAFFRLPAERKPFGEGPWPCLNPVSDHYQQPQIQECHIVYSREKGGRPVGTFACTCGFVYSRTGPDRSADDRFRLEKVKSFGPVWERTLQQLWEDPTVSLRKTARQLGVDPLTVKRHAVRLGLSLSRPRSRKGRLKPVPLRRPQNVEGQSPMPLEAYRATWLAAMKENPDAGMKILRSKLSQVYTWLYRHDPEWLKGHTPPRQKSLKPLPSRVNWEERDARLVEAVKAAALRLRSSQERPKQITIAAIGRETGQLALIQRHIDKLPLTSKALEELAETREAFAVRRIWWTAECYRQEDIQPVRWQLIRRAGVARLIVQPEVQSAIDAALQGLSQPHGVDNLVASE